MNASVEEWAIRYIEKYQLALVPIPPGSKGPMYQGWNQPGGYVMDAEEARERWEGFPDHGIGAVLGPSGICSFDADAPDHAEPVLGELGIDLRALREVTPTIQGNPSRYRLMFRAPPGAQLGRKILAWPARQPGEKPLTIFELRGGDVQDVFPPTIHPETGRPYTWLVPPNSEFPPLPEDLVELWQHWDSYRKELEAMCPWAKHSFNPQPSPRGDGARPNVIAAFNRAHSVEDLLKEHGYTPKGKRWLSPTSSTGLAGVVILGGKAFFHHASDPLADDHTHDAFDLFRVLDHEGDTRAAIKAAAQELGMVSASGTKASSRVADGGEVVHRCLFNIEPKPIRWLWRGRIARGKVTIVAGHPDLGKSQVTASMTAVVTTGRTWPVDRTPCEQGAVIVLSAEDTPEDTIRPRFEAAGADLKRVQILDAIREPNRDGATTTRPFNLAADIERLGGLAKNLGDVALILIDPITAYLGGVDSHNNAEVRAVLAPLAEMAAEIDAAVVCVSHLNKAGGTEAMLRVMGSLGFVAAARAAYLVAKDPDDDTRRLFLPMKNNLAEGRGGLAFRVKGKTLDGGIETSCVEWDAEPVTMTADEAMAPAGDPDPYGETTAKAEAEGWLRETLKGGDSMDGKRLKGLASDSGIKERTLYRASKTIGVVTLSGGFGKPRRWHLCPMPGKGCLVCQDPEDKRKPLPHDDLGRHGDSTPLKPSSGAGSSHVCQPSKEGTENNGGGTHGSKLGGMRVPGDSDVNVCQDRECVGHGGHVGGDDPAQEPPPGASEERDTGGV